MSCLDISIAYSIDALSMKQDVAYYGPSSFLTNKKSEYLKNTINEIFEIKTPKREATLLYWSL